MATTFWNYFEWLPDIWKFQVFVVEEKPITLGKIILGIVLFGLGYIICKTLSKEVEKKILSRLEIEHSLKHTLSTVIFYFMLVILTLFVLHLINVPVTIFTVLGGALAFGVGFGSQNIFKNFISGLLVMIERPIRVGDIIELPSEGIKGVVEHIGARSSLIKAADNSLFVVPNDMFIEKHILNWNLASDVVRGKVSVGVAYGSNATKVKELLLRACNENKDVSKFPEPAVLFTDFAESSLNFDLFFWTSVKNIDVMNGIASALRFKIYELFDHERISMPFPQRDIHLSTPTTLKVELTR